MPITPTNPIIKPAEPEKQYDKFFIKQFILRSKTPTRSTLSVIIAPYNSTTGEVYNDITRELYVDDVQDVASKNALVADAMTAIFAALTAYAKNQGIID